MKQQKWTEVEVAEAVVAYWQERGFEIFPEVDMGGPRADLVAVQGPLYVWNETKVGLNSAVMAQGLRAQRLGAHRVYVAAPKGKRTSEGRWFLEHAARQFGIGVLEVERPWSKGEPARVKELVPSKWIRDPPYLDTLKKACNPDTRIAVPGEANGVFMTDFRRTMNRIRAAVEKNPGMTTREVLAFIDHHYASDSSARGSLHRYADGGGRGKRKDNVLGKHGLMTRNDGRTKRWYALEGDKC